MNTIAVRTHDDFDTLIRHSMTMSWRCSPNKHNIEYVEVYNWNGTQKIIANFEYFIVDTRPGCEARKILYFSNPRVVNANIDTRLVFPTNPVRYLNRN